MSEARQSRLASVVLAAVLSLCLAGGARAQSTGVPQPGSLQRSSDALDGSEGPAEPIAPAEVAAVPAWLDALVRTQVIEATSSREERLQKLVELLFGADGLALQYDGSLTRTVAQSAESRKANCLSFALMFATLARRAGIDADVRETDFVLAWQGSDALYGNGHVNVGVRIGAARKIVDIDRSVISLRGEPRAISDERVLSHYYNNRGAELMAAGRLQDARKHMVRALELTPDFTAAWNNLGVLETRQGALAQAQQAYKRALEIDRRHSPTLSNMINLYRRLGDTKRGAEFEKRLFRIQHRDPFHQIILAMGYERNGNYAAALKHYRRAIQLKARDDFVYFGLARAYAHLGDTSRAIDALTRARDVAGRNRDLYQTKLDRLRHLHPSLVR